VVANDVSEPDAGFEHDTNRVLVLGNEGFEVEGSLMDKRAVAALVLDAVIDRRRSSKGETKK
jgi:phosphopantothenoylcysteine decarboxylase/phosphopantothenate--cysteine ligase